MAFLRGWLRVLVKRTDRPFTVAEELLIDKGLAAVMRLPPAERSLGALRKQMGFQDAEGAGARLERWCADGALGWAFDNVEDSISLSDRFIGFDMTDFLENAEIRTPVMMYMFHRIDEQTQNLGETRLLVFKPDETRKPLLRLKVGIGQAPFKHSVEGLTTAH